jgi:hypothetical protein
MFGIMPRRDVVLTGLIAFGAGVAVGANWKKLRKKLGPLLEKCGLQMADLGDFLSAASEDDFVSEAATAASKAEGSRPRRKKAATKAPGDMFASKASRRKNKDVPFPSVRPVKRKRASRKPVVMADAPRATGTYGA